MNEFLELRNEALQLGMTNGVKGFFRLPSPIVFNSTVIKEVNCMTGDIICDNTTIVGGAKDTPVTRMTFKRILEILKP
jgi:hypothetical protein